MDIDDDKLNGAKSGILDSDAIMDTASSTKLESTSKAKSASTSITSLSSSNADTNLIDIESTASLQNGVTDDNDHDLSMKLDPKSSASSSSSSSPSSSPSDSSTDPLDSAMATTTTTHSNRVEGAVSVEDAADSDSKSNAVSKSKVESECIASPLSLSSGPLLSRRHRVVGKTGVDPDGHLLPGFQEVSDDFEVPAFQSQSDFAIFSTQISSEIPLQRLVAVKRMMKSCHLWGEEAVLSVLPRVKQLSSDKEMVIRQAIAEVLGPFAKYLVETMSPFCYRFPPDVPFIDFNTVDPAESAHSHSQNKKSSPLSPQNESELKMDSESQLQMDSNHPTKNDSDLDSNAKGQVVEGKVRAHHVIITELLPLIKEMLKDAMEVRQGAGTSLIVIAELLNKEQVYEHILKIVLHMAHDDSDDQKITALPLLGDLAPIVGSAVCKNYLSADLHALSQDNSFRVRKATVQYFGPICEQLGARDAEECLLPIFLALCNDSIWSVRKGCVESFVDVSSSISSASRVQLIPIMEQFLNDSSRWVRNTAYEALGPFIASLHSDQIDADLLKYFTSIPHLSSAEADADCTNHCAFNMPAVLLTVGRERWPELQETYNILCRKTFKSRKTLACSLHEIAAILGTELTEKHLMNAMDFFLKDIDDIRHGTIKNLWKMLKVLSVNERKKYLSVLWEVASESDVNWRFRLILAEQLDEIVYLYPVDVVKEQMVPLMLQLCKDRMADVRYAAVYPIADAIKVLDAADDDLQSVSSKLETLYKGKTYSKRLLYIRIVESCFDRLEPDLFDRIFLVNILFLSHDDITNVRFCCARFIKKCLWSKERYRRHEGVVAAVEELKFDKDDVEIRRFFVAEEEIEEWLQSQRELRRQQEREERALRTQSQIDGGSNTPSSSSPKDKLGNESTDSSLYSSSESEDDAERDGDLDDVDDDVDGVDDDDGDEDDDDDDDVASKLKDIGDDLKFNKLEEMDIATIGSNELSSEQIQQQIMGATIHHGLLHQDTPRQLVIPKEVIEDEEEKESADGTGNYGLPMAEKGDDGDSESKIERDDDGNDEMENEEENDKENDNDTENGKEAENESESADAMDPEAASPAMSMETDQNKTEIEDEDTLNEEEADNDINVDAASMEKE